MAKKDWVTLEGFTEAKAALAALPEEFRAVAADTIEVGAAIIEGEAGARVPVDEGDLKASLGTNIRADRLQADVGFGDFKAAWVEFGTNDTPAQPSLWPGFQIGARYVRKQMRTWAASVASGLRLKGGGRTKRGRRPKAVRWWVVKALSSRLELKPLLPRPRSAWRLIGAALMWRRMNGLSLFSQVPRPLP